MIALLRSTDGNPDSRFEKYVNYLQENNFPYITVCWDRKGNKTETETVYYYKRPSSYGKRYGNVGGLFGFNKFLFKTLWKNRKRYSVIHACDFDTVVPAILIHILLRKKVIYDIFDWYVDSRSVKGILKWVIYIQEFFNIKMSEAVIICEEERRQQIIFTPKRLWILPNIPNFKEKQPEAPKNENLTIGYVGILASGRGLENLINYAKSNNSISLKIGGFGTQESMLQDVDKYENITYYGSVPYVKALEILNSADIVYAMYQKTNRNHILAAPNKYYEGLYLGKPIITTAGTIVGNKTLKYKTGFVIEESYDDLTSLFKSIKARDIAEFGQNAKALWDDKYSTYVTDFFNNTYRPFIEKYSK
jgi:glycosyltransferase involved in cell wall biosynthesis